MTFTLCTAVAAVFSKVLPEQRFCVKVGDRPFVLVYSRQNRVYKDINSYRNYQLDNIPSKEGLPKKC
jgi:hypothetical protein